MAIIAKFTRTLPAPTATISGGFVFLLSTAWFTQADQGVAGSPIDGGVNSLANGGGDMQIFSDTAATTRLPIDVVTFVTGGSPVAQVWVSTTSYTSGDTVTIGKDDTQIAQPAFGAAFGRNATWANDLRSYHLLESSGTIAFDSAGNANGDYNGNLPTLGANFGQDFDGTGDNVDVTNDAIDLSSFTFSVKANIDTFPAFMQLFTTDAGTSNRHWQWRILSTNRMSIVLWDSGSSIFINTSGTAALSTNTDYIFTFSFDGTSYKTFVNGVIDLNITDSTLIKAMGTTPAVIGDRAVTGNGFNGELGDLIVRDGAFKTDAQILSEYNNQSDPDNFGTSSEWVLVGGGGITLIVDANIDGPVFSVQSSITVPATTSNISVEITKPEFSSSVSVTLPKPDSNIDLSIASPVFGVSIDVTLPSAVSNVSIDVSKPMFSADASITLPQPSSVLDINIQAPVFSASMAITDPGTSSNIDLTISGPIFNAESSVTLPQPLSSVQFNISKPAFSASISVSGLDIIVGDNAKLTVSFESNKITLETQSNYLKV